ncbi:MAG: undecaprenyl-phosphate glucose phosphotransferase [bacterium]
MPGTYSRYIPIISITGDFALLNTLFVAGFCFQRGDGTTFAANYLLFYTYLNLTWLILVFVFRANKPDRNTSKKLLLSAYVKIIVFFFFLFLVYFQVTSLSYFPRYLIKYLFILFFTLLISWKFLLYYAFYLYRKQGYNFRDVIILGNSPLTMDLRRYFNQNKWHGYRLLGIFGEDLDIEKQVIGRWNEVDDFMKQTHVDEIYIAPDCIPESVMQEITSIISEYPVKINFLPDLGRFSFKTTELVSYGSLPLIQIHQGPLSYWYNRIVKRAFDIVLALLMIVVVLSWTTGIMYLISRLSTYGSVFFRQKRTGIDGREFSCIKFRTMKENPDSDLKQATMNDSRVTNIGKFLRKYSLDELPQFFNVLMGDMSVVGPRPHMLAHTEQYRKQVKSYMIRHTVKPGITGLAQVHGYRGEIRDFQDISNRVTFDVQYIELWTFNLDLKIILLTLWVLIRGQKEAY